MSKELSQIGKHFIVGLSSTVIEEEEKELLKMLDPLGIVIFKRNIASAPDWSQQLQLLINSVKKITSNDDLIVSIDHEGGKVHRLPDPATHFPPAKFWQHESKAVGKMMGQELRALGFNLSFAPVLDIFLEPKNTVIGDRAFSSIPDEVSRWAIEFAEGLEATGVMSCGKHFPGHGATIADSHFELPQRIVSKERLYNEELQPFLNYITAGFRMIMTGHVLFPELDNKNPATLSPQIITDLLRREIGFKGVVITDALEMKALGNTPPTEVAVKALNAGVDILLVAIPDHITPLRQATEMAQAILESLKHLELSKELELSSQERIAELKKHIKHLQEDNNIGPCTLETVGCQEHLCLNSILQKRITL